MQWARAHEIAAQLGRAGPALSRATHVLRGNENAGTFIPLDAKRSPTQEKIFLSVHFGENVSVKHEA